MSIKESVSLCSYARQSVVSRRPAMARLGLAATVVAAAAGLALRAVAKPAASSALVVRTPSFRMVLCFLALDGGRVPHPLYRARSDTSIEPQSADLC